MHPDPIVIMGAPRSGTTYLNTILNKHPDVFVSHETRIFVWMHLALTDALDHPQRLLSHKEDFVPFASERLAEMVRDFYRRLRPDAVYWGDKNPHYASPKHAGTMPMIRDLYQGSKFIHVYRDGRDVVASLLRKRFPDGRKWTDFEEAHEIWNGHIVMGHEFGETIEANRFMEIRYETLIQDDVEHARGVFEFLGIDFAPQVEEFCRRQATERTPLSGPTRSLEDSARKSEWAEMLSADEQRRSLEALHDNLVRFGYDVSAPVAAEAQ